MTAFDLLIANEVCGVLSNSKKTNLDAAIKDFINLAKEVKEAAEKMPGITYIPELDRDQMAAFYNQIDCLVCASRDDAMPVVVTEACMFSKLIICSENTGSASILNRHNAGLIFRDNDPGELRDCMVQIFDEGKKDLDEMRKNARIVYEEYFTNEVFESKIDSIIEDLISNKKNGSEQERYLAGILREYKKDKIELLEVKKENRILKEALNTIENAFFWKISKPIRLVLDFVKQR